MAIIRESEPDVVVSLTKALRARRALSWSELPTTENISQNLNAFQTIDEVIQVFGLCINFDGFL